MRAAHNKSLGGTIKKLLLMIAFLILLSLAAFAQNITEYGQPAELRGVTKIYISLVFAGPVELKGSRQNHQGDRKG